MFTIPKKVVELIMEALSSNFTGTIRINLYQGIISSVNRDESIKI